MSGFAVLSGHCDEDLGAPYQPFVEALQNWSTAVPPGTLATAAGRGLHDLRRLLSESERCVPSATQSCSAHRRTSPPRRGVYAYEPGKV